MEVLKPGPSTIVSSTMSNTEIIFYFSFLKDLCLWSIYVNHTVVEFCKFSLVPAIGCAYEVASDALQLVDMLAATLRTNLQIGICIFISAVHATVSVVVYRAITNIELIHHIHHIHNYLWIVGGITINLYIEHVSTTGQVVIRCFHLSLVTG